MLYNLFQTRSGKETLFMTDSLPKCRARMLQLRQSTRGKNWQFQIRPAEETDEKYRKPPCMNFDPSGDTGSKKHLHRKARAKKIRKRNP